MPTHLHSPSWSLPLERALPPMLGAARHLKAVVVMSGRWAPVEPVTARRTARSLMAGAETGLLELAGEATSVAEQAA